MAVECEIRPIRKDDDAAMCAVIRTVMPEFGANGPGFAIHDPEVSGMFEAYNDPASAYFVIVQNGRVVGGCGIGPLSGAGKEICELRKMYFLREVRGRGYGLKMLTICLEKAKEIGYGYCYLETLETMAQAKLLYDKNGFAKLSAPMGDTGHFGCDAWYLKEL